MESSQLPADRIAVLRMMPMPADANIHGDVFGGWIMGGALLLACLGPLVSFPIETDLPAFPGVAVRCSLTGDVPVCAVSTPLVMHIPRLRWRQRR